MQIKQIDHLEDVGLQIYNLKLLAMKFKDQDDLLYFQIFMTTVIILYSTKILIIFKI